MPVVYYVRHGLTEWNADGRLQGRHDSPLTAEGRKQSIRSGVILQDLLARDGRAAADLAYVSSPLMRARATMELLRATLGVPKDRYDLDDRLAEIAFGEWEGLSYEDVIKRDPDVVMRREGDKWGFTPPGGESYTQLAVRVGDWYRALTCDTVVAAHGGTARALIAHLRIVPPEDATHYSIDQGVVYVFSANGVARYA